MALDKLEPRGGAEDIGVALSHSELVTAAAVGVMRMASSVHRMRRPRFAYESGKDAWGKHVLGALGECAAAKGLNVYWNAGVDVFSVPDVGVIEVRTNEDGRFLKVMPDTPNERVHLLVVAIDIVGMTCSSGVFMLAGWIEAGDAKREEWLRDPGKRGRPAHFVPRESLYPVGLLKARIGA